MSAIGTLLKKMSNLHTRKAKAFSKRRQTQGDDVVLCLPSGIALRTQLGSLFVPKTKHGKPQVS